MIFVLPGIASECQKYADFLNCFPRSLGEYIYSTAKKRECFKIGIVSRKRLKLKPKCPRCDDNAPELYLLKQLQMLIDFRLLY